MEPNRVEPARASWWKSVVPHGAGDPPRVAFAVALCAAALALVGAGRPDDVDCPASAPVYFDDGAQLHIVSLISRKPPRILAIGSSSTAGVGASASRFTYPAQLQTDLAAAWGSAADVVNAGIGGETAVTTVARLKAVVKTDKPDLVIWQVGANDALTDLDEPLFRKLLKDGVAAAQNAKVALILLDPQLFPGVKNIARYERFVQIIREVGEETRTPVFSRYALMKDWSDVSPGVLRTMLSKDSFHMSDRGYECLARRLAADISPLWSGRVSFAAKPSVGAPMAR